ncbi:MAG TPA: hypothetical protein VM536_00485, partial [Chloroflexia bacterium]|nr:hypothetical protein [Chloroflexia bacterium]
MADLDAILARQVVYTVPGMDAARVHADLVYKIVDEDPLAMDVYTPGAGSDGPWPAVILVHGDGPPVMLQGAKDWGQYQSWGRIVAASGLAAVTFNHRSSHRLTRMADVAADIDDLIAHVRAESGPLRLDPDRMAIAAF